MNIFNADVQNLSSLSIKFTIVFLGISNLIAWNAILNSLGYFSDSYSINNKNLGQKVPFWFPIPYLFANFFLGPLMPYISQKLTIRQRIIGGLTILQILLIFYPILSSIAPNSLGFSLSLVLTFVIGCCGAIQQNTQIGLITQIGGKIMSLYWVAESFSGLIMNICSFLTTLIFGYDLLWATISYFIVASLFSFVSIFLFIKIEKNINQLAEKQQANQSLLSQVSNNQASIADSASEIQKIYMKLKTGLKIVKMIPFFVWLNYVQTFTMYPGVMLLKVFNSDMLKESVWSILILFTIYNIGDILGKSITIYRQTYSKKLSICVVFSRFFFFITFLLIASGSGGEFINDDIFCFVNSFLFALTNGYATASLLSLGSQCTNNPNDLEIIGFINSFSLTFGITCGTFLALIFEKSNQWEW